MKLTAQVKLLPTPEQAAALRQTLERANAACQFVSNTAWETRIFRQYDLHHQCYRAVRERFGLSAQVAVRVIAKVADAYKLDRKAKRTFQLTGSLAFDDRILSWRMQDRTVSIWTVNGRLRIPFACGERQRELLQTRQGESDLVLDRARFFLSAACEVEEAEPVDVEGALGVDLGVVNIAVDSDGEVHSARHINNVRHHQRRLRTKLQAKGTRSANASSNNSRAKNAASHRTPIIASASRLWRRRKTQSAPLLSKICGASGRGLRFVAASAPHCTAGHSPNCVPLSNTKRNGRVSR